MTPGSDGHDEGGEAAGRLDRWLFATRLFKSRSLAAEAVHGGRVHVNGDRVKPARAVRAGDVVTFSRGAVHFECTVKGIPLRRGPAREAQLCYKETERSRVERDAFAARMRTASALAPRPDERPDKHGRRELRRLRGRD
jgi:ribosome-associated heat shock protein Hsp15